MLNVLILQQNELVNLTINSIKKNMPNTTYKVVNCKSKPKIKTALENISETTLVVSSGLILNVSEQDLPPIEKLNDYPICVSRAGVYTDHRNRANYKVIEKPLNKGHIDLSIFVINPSKWNEIPESDAGVLKDLKPLYMPRYMNHKTDVQVNEALSAYPCLQYGVLGLSAAVHNYVNNILTGEATVSESYAYNFDKLEEYTDGLNDIYKNNIKQLSNKTKRISNFRDALNNIKET